MTSLATPNRRPSGFTLVELLLVLAVAVALAAMAAPSLYGSMDRARLDAAAEDVRSAWAEARLQAMRAGEPLAFQAQLGSGEYRVTPLASAGDPAAPPTVETQPSIAANPEGSEDLGAVTFVQISNGVAGDPAIDPSVAACLVFRADGSTDDAFAVIQSADGRRRTIMLRGLTGAARIDEAPAATP